MPYQCFINGKFEDSENGKTYDSISPTDGSVSHMTTLTMLNAQIFHAMFTGSCLTISTFNQVICKVSYASVGDVDRAVAAAKEAYENGPWGKMNPRDRGSLLYR